MRQSRFLASTRRFRGRLVRAWRRLRPVPVPTPLPASVEPAQPPLAETGFEAVSEPAVSIVIPVHGRFEHTWRCLESLRLASVAAGFEVVVVDDASPDETRRRLQALPNLRLVTQEENRGFVHSCNRGAAEARGSYLVFLNNDTVVTDGWLDELVETFDRFPDVGVAGAKLLYPSGRLQEAGGVVWRDGSAHNYGRSGHPDAPPHDYPRRVDYASGACIMVPRQLFLDLGGFDELFAPAYYEDVDLAFQVRHRGLHVYYQPRARVYHLEGATSGTRTSHGVKRFQTVNRVKFERKWRHALQRHPQRGADVHSEKDRLHTQRVLIVDHRTPTPDQDAGSARILGVVDLLVELGCKVTFLPVDLTAVEPYAEQARRRGVELLAAPFVRSARGHLKHRGDDYDLVILSRFAVAERYAPLVKRYCPRARLILDTVDLHHLRERRAAELAQDATGLERAAATERRELAVAHLCDVTWVASDAEQELLRKALPTSEVRVVPTIYPDHPGGPAYEDRRDLLFVGGFEHAPNVDGVLWFAREILPLVRRSLPDVRLRVVGSRAPNEIRALGSPAIEIEGHVPDLGPLLDGCRLSVAPLRYGAGIKGKVHQSLASGLPCVATSIAVEGLGVESGRELMVADEAADFAAAVVSVYGDAGLWARLAGNGRVHARAHLSSARVLGVLEEMLAGAGLRTG